MSIEPLPIHYGQGDHAKICIIELDQPGKAVVVLELELIQRLEAAIDALPQDARGLVLASASERSFVAGADLKSIMAMDDEQLHKYLEYGASVFGKLSRLPYPTAAAINGAALGGGLELAMHCDGLIGAPSPSGKPYPVGLPEAGLSICPGWGGTQMLPARIDAKAAIEMTAVGKPMTYDDAVSMGLFDATCAKAGDLRGEFIGEAHDLAHHLVLELVRRLDQVERHERPLGVGHVGPAIDVDDAVVGRGVGHWMPPWR